MAQYNNRDRIEIPQNAQFVRVSTEWLAACGLERENPVMEITRIRGRLPGGAVVVDVARGSGCPWTVILPWRGEFVE